MKDLFFSFVLLIVRLFQSAAMPFQMKEGDAGESAADRGRGIGRDHWSTHGALHAWGSVMVIPVAPITASLISLAFSRRRRFSLQARRLLWAATAVIWLSLIAFIAGGGTKFEGTRGPGDWTGWANRIFIVGFGIWMMIVAWKIIQAFKAKSTASRHGA